MHELRKDPVLNRWVAVLAEERIIRDGRFKPYTDDHNKKDENPL